MKYNFEDIVNIQSIVKEAAQISLHDFYRQTTASVKPDGSIVTEADLAMQNYMSQKLQVLYPEVRMLSEEIDENEQLEVLGSGSDYWCLDPLDGTNNYHSTIPLFSVSLALISSHEAILAIVYDPIRQEFFAAIKGQGFWIDNEKAKRPRQPEVLNQSIALVDFKRLPIEKKRKIIEGSPYKSQRCIGTCALEWAWLAAGRSQLLIHGSEKFWDYAAGNLLTMEAGGYSRTFEGENVFVESLESRSVVAASTRSLFELWSHWLAID